MQIHKCVCNARKSCFEDEELSATDAKKGHYNIFILKEQILKTLFDVNLKTSCDVNHFFVPQLLNNKLIFFCHIYICLQDTAHPNFSAKSRQQVEDLPILYSFEDTGYTVRFV